MDINIPCFTPYLEVNFAASKTLRVSDKENIKKKNKTLDRGYSKSTRRYKGTNIPDMDNAKSLNAMDMYISDNSLLNKNFIRF
jgi:hypothetical protein